MIWRICWSLAPQSRALKRPCAQVTGEVDGEAADASVAGGADGCGVTEPGRARVSIVIPRVVAAGVYGDGVGLAPGGSCRPGAVGGEGRGQAWVRIDVGEVDQPGAGDLRVEHRTVEVVGCAEADDEAGGGGEEGGVGVAEGQVAREQGHQEPVRRGPEQRAFQREARRPVCTECGAEVTDERWKEFERVGWGSAGVFLKGPARLCAGTATGGSSPTYSKPGRPRISIRNRARRPCPSRSQRNLAPPFSADDA